MTTAFCTPVHAASLRLETQPFPSSSFFQRPAAKPKATHRYAPATQRKPAAFPPAASMTLPPGPLRVARKALSVAAATAAAAAVVAASAAQPGPALASGLNSVPFRLEPAQSQQQETPGSLHAHWDVHSMQCDTETFVVFANEAGQVIDLWWVDYTGREVFYASINPGTTYMQQSYASHPWVVREHLSQNSVLMVVATEEPLMAVVHSV